MNILCVTMPILKHLVSLKRGHIKNIIENVANASQMPPAGAYSVALPMKIQEGTEAPVRLVEILG